MFHSGISYLSHHLSVGMFKMFTNNILILDPILPSDRRLFILFEMDYISLLISLNLLF